MVERSARRRYKIDPVEDSRREPRLILPVVFLHALGGKILPPELSPSDEDVTSAVRRILATVHIDRAKEILIARYGLESGVPQTLNEVGYEFGVVGERIRQIEAKTFAELRSGFETNPDSAFDVLAPFFEMPGGSFGAQAGMLFTRGAFYLANRQERVQLSPEAARVILGPVDYREGDEKIHPDSLGLNKLSQVGTLYWHGAYPQAIKDEGVIKLSEAFCRVVPQLPPTGQMNFSTNLRTGN